MPGKKPLQIGITGGIGSGKSVVARIFGLHDVPVYESDSETKKLYFYPEVRKEVELLLGSSVYTSDAEIDRVEIARRIYSDPELRIALNNILHPAVGRHYAHWVACQTHPYVLKVAALLFEADIYKSLDFTLLVISPTDLKISRIGERDPFRTESQIMQIIESQMKDEDKILLADGLIYNDEKQSLLEQVDGWNSKFCSGDLISKKNA